MTALGLGLCGAAVLAAPARNAGADRMRLLSARLGAAGGTPPRCGPRPGRRALVLLGTTLRRAGPVPAGVAVAVLGAVSGGPAVGVATGIAAAVSTWLVRGRAGARRLRAEVDLMLEAVTALTGELRAGATPEAALWAAAHVSAGASRPDSGGARSSPGPPTGSTLGTAAATASLGGAVPAALRAASGECHPELGVALRRIAAGWQVSERCGAPLGTVLDRVEQDLRARRRQSRQVEAHLAGPRATGAMLALLPGFGVLLGTAMGARPLAVLVHTGAGQLALLAGVGLDALGALWTARLLRVGAR